MLINSATCRHIMERALRTPFRLECGPDIVRTRQCFYRTRQSCQNQGNLRFDGLRFYLDGGTLVIKSLPVNPVKQLRRKLKLLREMGAYVDGHGGWDDPRFR